MTGNGHKKVNAAFSLSAAYLTYTLLTANSIPLAIVAALFTILGARAPDWLEIPLKSGHRIITHRTITHWFPIWVLLIIGALHFNYHNAYGIDFISDHPMVLATLSLSVIFFSFGCLLHILFDLPNPMGIPFLSPVHRFSLNLWKSGSGEKTIILFSWLLNILFIAVDTGLMILKVPEFLP